MPSLVVLAPVLLPVASAALLTALGLAGQRTGRLIAAAGVWGAVLALLATWLSVRSTQELNLGPLGFGSMLHLRIDAVAFVFGMAVLLPSALLLSVQPRTWQEMTVASLGVGAAMGAIESGGVVLTALAGGTAATLAVVLLDTEDVSAPRPRWSVLLAAWLALSWAGTILQVRAGTAEYAAVPVSALTAPVFALLALAGLMASGLFPWRSWPARIWSRPSRRAAGLVAATLYPLGFYLLVRAYELGDGRYPHPLFHAGLASLGVLVALGAAIRAQRATTRRDFLGEVVPCLGGFALMAVTLGTPVGLVAGLATLAMASAMTACLAVLPDRASLSSLVAIAAAAGLPPGLAFGARVVGIESTFEAGDFLGLIGIAGAVSWVVWLVASARAIGLPAGLGHPAPETSPRIAALIAGLTLVAGPALAAFRTAVANPAQAVVMPLPTGSLGGGLTTLVTVSTVLPTLALFTPLLVVGILAYGLAGTSLIRTQPRPALFSVPGEGPIARLGLALRAAAVPEQYRSIIDLRAVELAASGGRPLMWLGALVALAFAVTR